MKAYWEFLRTEARWLTFGLLLTFVSSLGQTFFISLFVDEIRTTLDLSHTAISSYYAAATITSGIIIFWVGRGIDHWPLHLFTGFTLVGLSAAGFILAVTHEPWLLFPAFMLLRLCGQGLSSHIAMTSMARWYARNRGKAISIANLGMPVGEALLPILAVAVMIVIGWRQSWVIYSLLLLVLLTPLILSLVWSGERTPASTLKEGGVDPLPSWNVRDVLRDLSFWLMMPAAMGPSWIFTGLFFHQVTVVEAKGWDFRIFALAYIGYAIAKVASSLLSGVLVDRVNAKTLAPFTMPVMSLSLLFLIGIDHPAAAWAFMIILGLHVGAHMTAMSALWAELYGRQFLGSIKSAIMAIGVIASAIGPPIFGVVLDAGLGTNALLLFCAAYGIVAAILLAFAINRHGRLQTAMQTT